MVRPVHPQEQLLEPYKDLSSSMFVHNMWSPISILALLFFTLMVYSSYKHLGLEASATGRLATYLHADKKPPLRPSQLSDFHVLHDSDFRNAGCGCCCGQPLRYHPKYPYSLRNLPTLQVFQTHRSAQS